jgi:hypothetical protein
LSGFQDLQGGSGSDWFFSSSGDTLNNTDSDTITHI